MKKAVSYVLFGVIALGAAVGMYSFMNQQRHVNEKNALTLYGNVDIREVDLGFRVSGKVNQVFFDEGDRVQPGDLLATLDAEPYDERVALAGANVLAMQITLRNAQKQYERRSKAITTAAVSEEEFENSQATQEQYAANLAAAEASLAITLTQQQDTQLYSPSSGMILTRIREPGSVLREGEPIFTLSLDSPLWIRAYIAEPDLGKIFPGMQAEIHTDTNSVYKGHIGFISPVAEFTPKNVESPQLRTDLVFRLRIIVDNPDRGLRQGMPITVTIPPQTKPQEASQP